MSTGLRCEIFPDDLDATEDFYVRVLGFTLSGRDSDYLALTLGEARIGAARREPAPDVSARCPPVGVELVIEVDDVAATYADVCETGWPIAAELQDRPWGLRDFRLLDPSGYYLRITGR